MQWVDCLTGGCLGSHSWNSVTNSWRHKINWTRNTRFELPSIHWGHTSCQW